MTALAGALFGLAMFLLALAIARGALATVYHEPGLLRQSDGCLAIAFTACTGYFALTGSLPGAVACAAGAALYAWLWQRTRKRRDRAPRAYGLKSRARLPALAARAREALIPRRVLRPVPGSAG